MRVWFLLLFSLVLISACSTLKMGNDHYITLVACQQATSCENSFLIHSFRKVYVDQLIFEAEVPLIGEGFIKNTRAGSQPYLGAGFNSEHPLALIVPIGQQLGKNDRMRVSIIHAAPRPMKLKLKYPLGISVEEPTR